MNAQAVIERVIEAGGSLSLNGDKIHVSAPSPLPADILSELRSRKPEVITLLSEAGMLVPDDTTPSSDSIRARFEQCVSTAESEHGLSKVDAALKAWDQDKICVLCHRDTEGEADAVRVAKGGWLHMAGCYDEYFGFLQGQ